MTSISDLAQRIIERADVLASISEEPDRLTRRFATPAMRQANELVAGWMREAGMAVRVDNIGNLIGRYEVETTDDGRPTTEGPTPTLILGSHLDTVRDAGKYDGPLGVLVALACVERLRVEGRRLPFVVEVVAFADEEGLRFGTSYLGSKVFADTFDAEYLERTDEDGVTMVEAIRAAGGDPAALPGDARSPEGVIGYCEVHIEQGPVLEREGLPVGVVSAIAGQTRARVDFRGEAGHAGTVPMEMRRDALCAAAEFALTAEALARGTPGLVATVGQMEVQPGASNVIPGRAILSLDVRHQEDGTRERAVEALRQQAGEVADLRAVSVEWTVLQENRSVPCSPSLAGKLGQGVEMAGYTVRYLPSGAGHDAATMSSLCPVAMLFMRCRGGVSHNPAESVEVGDVAVAIEVVSRFLDLLSDDFGDA